MGCGCGKKSAAPTVLRESIPASSGTKMFITDYSTAAKIDVPPPAAPTSAPAQNGLRSLATRARSSLGGAISITKTTDSASDMAQRQGVPVVREKKGYGLINVLKDTITGNANYSNTKLQDSRLALCNACPKLLAGACTECGCIVKLKVKYEESSCPIGKW